MLLFQTENGKWKPGVFLYSVYCLLFICTNGSYPFANGAHLFISNTSR